MAGTGISIDGYEPKHLSYSTMDGYRGCPKRFQLQKVIGKEQLPGLAGLGGNAVHLATEWYDVRGGPDQGDVDPEKMFHDAWKRELKSYKERSPSFTVDEYTATGRAAAKYGGKRNKDWWLDNGPSMVQKWIDWRRETQNDWLIFDVPTDETADELAVELEIRVNIGGFDTLMFIDRAMVSPAGMLTVLDIKTGRIPETAEQLGLYATGLELKYGKTYRPHFGYFWSPDKGLSKPYDLSRYTEDWFGEQFRQTRAGINAGFFVAKPANSCKNWCGVARFCEAVGGTLDHHDVASGTVDTNTNDSEELPENPNF